MLLAENIRHCRVDFAFFQPVPRRYFARVNLRNEIVNEYQCKFRWEVFPANEFMRGKRTRVTLKRGFTIL